MKKIGIIALTLLSLSMVGISYAQGNMSRGFMGNHAMGNHGMSGFELIQMLDLTEEQEQAIEDIRKGARDGKPSREDMKDHMKAIMELNPDDPDYQQTVERIAAESAQNIEQMIIQRGKVKAEIYQLLTHDQRLELDEMKQKMMRKFEKRMNRRNG